MDKDRVVWFYAGTRCTYRRHPEFTSGSHEIGEDNGMKRHAKPTEFSIKPAV